MDITVRAGCGCSLGWVTVPTDANKRRLLLGGIIRVCSSKVGAGKASRCH